MAKPKQMTIPTRHADRVRAVKERRDAIDEARQALAWKHRDELEQFDGPNGPAGAMRTFEGQVAAFEAKLETEIAAEAFAALRAGAQAYGDTPKTATLAVRDAWRSYVARVRDELGSEEPNFLLLVASFLDAGKEDALGSTWFLDGRRYSSSLTSAVLALASESVPRAVQALQHLNIGVDAQACEAFDACEANPEIARGIESAATHATVFARAPLGDRVIGAIGESMHALAEQRATAAAREAARPKTLVERAKTAVAAVVSAVTGGSSAEDEHAGPEASVFDGDAAFHAEAGGDAFQGPG